MRQLAALVTCIILATTLQAQTTNGTLRGTVTDPSGAVLVNATITARNENTGLIATAATTNSGLYSLPSLPPGTYSLTVESPNLRTYTREGVNVQTASTISLDITMQLGGVTDTVVVNADAYQLETATSDIGATVERALIENLPLEVSGTVRNPVQFITLIPGFVGTVGNNPGSNNTDDFKVNGGQENSTDILVDGVSISLVSPNTQFNKGISTEAVQEFKVLQSNFSPEYGESGDGIVSLTLKSGTNHIHGSFYDFLRNKSLDANSWVNNTAGAKKRVNTQNDFGGTVGGPVRLPHLYNGTDKTFFFFDYEGFRFRTGGFSTRTVPNEAFRKGDFSALLPKTQLYDPTTHAPIPGNILTNDPNFKLSTVASKIFSFLPATSGGLQGNVNDPTVSTTTADIYDVKIDHAISQKQRLSGGIDWNNTKTGGTSSLGPIFGSSTTQVSRYARVSDDYILSPTLLNHLLFGFSRRFRTEASNTLGQGYPAQLGLTGVQNTTFPCIKFFGGVEDANLLNNCGDSQFADNVYQVNDGLNYARGAHVFKFGGEMRALQFNVRRLTQSSGEFDFNARQTADLAGAGGDPVASALFGLSDTTTLNYGAYSGVRYKDISFYAQDTYKVKPKLTLNYGMRYDLDLPAKEAFNRFSAVDPTLPNPGAGGRLGAYTYFGSGAGRNGITRPQDIHKKGFGPRAGFAYSINEKTVFRGGYGIFYEPLKEGSFADQDGLGFFNKQTVSPSNGGPTQIDNGVTHLFPVSGPLTPDAQNGSNGIILVPRNSGRPADVQSWNLDVQRQITSNLLVSVAYVGSKGSHLPALNIIPNQIDPAFLTIGSDLGKNITCLGAVGENSCPKAVAAGVASPYPGFTGSIAQALRPFPQYGDFNQEDNSFTPDRTGNSTYNAMQLQVDKRMAQGLSVLVSYTISKNLTDADSSGPGVSGFTGTNEFIGQNSYDRHAEKALSQLDTPESLVASLFYELPVGHGKKFLNKTGAMNAAVGGWFASGIGSYRSGNPTEVYANCGGTAGDALFAGCHFTGAARVNVVPGVHQTNKDHLTPASTPFWNAAAFAVPAPLSFGNEPRSLGNARFYAGKNEDVTLGKKTEFFDGKFTLDFRGEFFNIFNRHIYLPDVGAAKLTDTYYPAHTPNVCPDAFACGFGAIRNASGPRTIQLGLKATY